MTMMEEREELVAFARKLDEKGFVAAADGNLSLRRLDGGFLSTPTATPKAELRAELIAELDTEGRPIKGKPSSEWPLHMALYKMRRNIGAVVHAHPPFATALACSGHAMDSPFLSETVISLGTVPLVPFVLPSTGELAEKVAEAMKDHQAVLLANHGVVTVGPDIRTAYYHLETLEQTARIFLYSELLGGRNPLPEASVRRLKDVGSTFALASLPSPACKDCPVAAGEGGAYFSDEELVRMLAEYGEALRGWLKSDKIVN